jgi:hypothetical protein
MTIKSSSSRQVYREVQWAFNPDHLESEREKRILQSRVSLLAKIGLKPLEERIDWSKTASSGGRNLVMESFIQTYSLNPEFSVLRSSRSAPMAELSPGNQWLELCSSHTRKTPLSGFFKKIGLLNFPRPALNRNIALSRSLDLLAEMLEQEKKTCDLEDFTFTYDDLGELDLQMQTFAYKKLAWLLTKFVKVDPIADELKAIIASEEPEDVKMMQCKKALETLPDHLFSRILSSLFSSGSQIETKAKELFFNGSSFVKPADLKWDPQLSIADQWVQRTVFEVEASQAVYSEYQKKIKDLRIQSLVDASTSDLEDLKRMLEEKDYQTFLGPRIDFLRNSLPSFSKPPNTLYERFSQFHTDLTLKYEQISSLEPAYRRLADLAYANYSPSALNSSLVTEGSESDFTAALALFVSAYLGSSEAVYPTLLTLWNTKMEGLRDDKTSPFYLFLESRGFFSKSSQEMGLSLKVSRLISYQALFDVLTNLPAKKLGLSFGDQSNHTSATSERARCLAFACFKEALLHVKPALERRFLHQIASLQGSAKEKILQAESLLTKLDHPDKESLLMIVTGSFIGDKNLEPVIQSSFSFDEEVTENPVIKAFVSAMNIQDRRGASYDENYFERGEAFVKFKNYLIEHVRDDQQFVQQLKQLKDSELEQFATTLLLKQSQAKEWIKGMQKLIDQQVEWLKKKAQTYKLTELTDRLSRALTGHEKMIAVSKGFHLLEVTLKQEISDKKRILIFERFVEESCLAENMNALDYVIQKMEGGTQ